MFNHEFCGYDENYPHSLCVLNIDSEKLLSTISASHFSLASVSPDISHLVASTYDNNLLFINLPEYFQVCCAVLLMHTLLLLCAHPYVSQCSTQHCYAEGKLDYYLLASQVAPYNENL